MIAKLLPRHLQIIYDINLAFLTKAWEKYGKDSSIISELSCVEEYPLKCIRMAHLSIIASHAVNGVAKIHSEIIRDQLFKQFSSLDISKFTNVTNGVT